MARISVVQTVGTYRVTLEGRLMAADLQRLEQACRHALEHKLMPLELNLDRVSAVDAAARFYLEQLRARGAAIHDAGGALQVGDSH